MVALICSCQVKYHQWAHPRRLYRREDPPWSKCPGRCFGRTEPSIQEGSVCLEMDNRQRSRPHIRCKATRRYEGPSTNAPTKAVYQSLLHLSWIDKLLDNLKIIFVDLYKDQIRKPYISVIECDFDPYFDQQMRELEGGADQSQTSQSLAIDELTPPSSSGADTEEVSPPVPSFLDSE